MNNRFKTIVMLLASLLAISIIYGVYDYYTNSIYDKPLEVYQRTRLEGRGMSLELIESAEGILVLLPKSFNVGQVSYEVGQKTKQYNKKHLFNLILKPDDTLEYFFNSSNLIRFTIAVGDSSTWTFRKMDIIVDEQNSTSFYGNFTANDETVICFRFETELSLKAHVTFNGMLLEKAIN